MKNFIELNSNYESFAKLAFEIECLKEDSLTVSDANDWCFEDSPADYLSELAERLEKILGDMR